MKNIDTKDLHRHLTMPFYYGVYISTDVKVKCENHTSSIQTLMDPGQIYGIGPGELQ
ncbi:hypothetical protein HanRHA438_Chr14g0659091 [Helianthus annuus]|nr:hypothetical protein HanRHA438_Chr14g0659091 [Helianthus annuus]